APGAGARRGGWTARAPSPPLLGRAYAALGAATLAAGRPIEAGTAFKRAQTEGVGSLAQVGLGATAIAEGKWPEATSRLTEARDGGTADVAAIAGYGLAVVAFQRGEVKEFKQPGRAALCQGPQGGQATRLVFCLIALP